MNLESKHKKYPKLNRNIPLNDMIFLLGLSFASTNIKVEIINT